jgi:hypothetical protein
VGPRAGLYHVQRRLKTDYMRANRRREVSFKPRPLYPRGKNPGMSLDRRLGGPQSRSGPRGEEIKNRLRES